MTNPNDRSTAGPKREVYVAPTILYREPLEAVAAVCSPAGMAKVDPGSCPQGPYSS